MSFKDGTKELIDAVRRDKYMLPKEKTWDESLGRVATHLSTDNRHYESLIKFLKSGIIVPAGRILAGAGTSRNVTLINCFVMNTLKDSLMGDEGIMDTLARSAKTMQMGGGIGVDFSPIRPRGALVSGVDAPASGVIPFMDMWNSMCSTIMSAGSRRGAMMATLRCDHPDLWNPDPKIDTFLSAKRQPGRLTNFNISVLVTDLFMEAVKNNREWHLFSDVPPFNNSIQSRTITQSYVYRTVPARELWNQILQNTYKFAEPGIIFIDRVNEKNPLKDIEVISSTNPCGEQPLPPNGDCNLSAINLAKLVVNPFTPQAYFDYSLFADAVECAVEMLDNVIDATKFPLAEQELEGKRKRRIGLGFTGLANAMMMLGIRYGSDSSIEFTKQVCKTLRYSAYLESVKLAKIRGVFPAFSHAQASILENLRYTELATLVSTFGLRNGVLLTIAPTGTTSIAQGDNCSSGIEPVFALEYKRKVLQSDGSFAEHTVRDYGYQQWMNHPDSANIDRPDWLVTTADLTPAEHIAVQAAAQEYIDSSISKTVNCPAEMTFEDFSKVYDLAYESGCKGCTTYRPDPDSGRGSVLSIETKPKEEPLPPELAGKRPQVLAGVTYKLRWPHQDEALYLTINSWPDGKPFEVFLTSKNVTHSEWTAAVTRLLSAIFRKGGDLDFIVDELTQVMSADGGALITPPGYTKPKHVPSIVALIGYALEDFFGKKPKTTSLAVGRVCPSCQSDNYRFIENCWTCGDCGYGKCG
jgi:ribonucleoside-diphosphate reductase alpha chain